MSGISQLVLAGRLGRSESWVSQIERGERRIDRLSVIEELATVLEVDAATLLGWWPQPPRIHCLRPGDREGDDRAELAGHTTEDDGQLAGCVRMVANALLDAAGELRGLADRLGGAPA
jgi:transcriptional regulator with XRE-family HTH domain